MTKTSLTELVNFLNHYKPEAGRTADFGGTDAIGKNIVKNTLASGGITDYHMLDFDNGVDLREPVKGKKFDLGICMDLLEHTTDPFLVAKNIKNSLKKGAYLFVTVPFIWEVHLYPGDYWRFTTQGLQQLFIDMELHYAYMIEDDAPGADFKRYRTVGIFSKK